MVPCPKCKHSNFDGFAACSRCGAPLGATAAGEAPAGFPTGPGASAPRGPVGLGGGSAGGGLDEYQRLMADRAKAQKRNRTIVALVVVVVLGGGGFWVMKEKRKAAAALVVLEAGGRFAEKDKTEMGSFWNCVMSSEVDIGMFQSADQIQQRVESAYFTQQKTFSEHLTSECVPKMERARAAMSSVASEAPPEMKDAFDKYLATLPKLQSGIESYAEKIKGRSATKDVDQTLQEVGGAFSAEASVESTAFEKFLVCAIPDLDKKKDIQGVLEYLATTCKTDAVKFMTRVREQCGPLIQNLDKDGKASPSKTFKANVKKFYEEDQRQLQAWEYCAKRSRKGKKVLDLEAFLTASGDYIEARIGVVDAAREGAARITGKPLEVAKKKAAPGAAEAP
jgi:hypothetical protein